jgi:hypothetical protein
LFFFLKNWANVMDQDHCMELGDRHVLQEARPFEAQEARQNEAQEAQEARQNEAQEEQEVQAQV